MEEMIFSGLSEPEETVGNVVVDDKERSGEDYYLLGQMPEQIQH